MKQIGTIIIFFLIYSIYIYFYTNNSVGVIIQILYRYSFVTGPVVFYDILSTLPVKFGPLQLHGHFHLHSSNILN